MAENLGNHTYKSPLLHIHVQKANFWHTDSLKKKKSNSRETYLQKYFSTNE